MELTEHELGACLRSWRDRLGPADAGLPAGHQRRVPGLRREEVAQLAGVSVDYLTRLEQGRAASPSASVLDALARALRLSDDERAHLFRLGGQLEPRQGTIDRHLTPSLQRLLDRLTDVPAMVVDVAGGIVAANPLATALTGDFSGASRRERNIAWRHFTGEASRIVRSPEEEAAAEEGMVAELHDALGRYPADEELNSLIDDLKAASSPFAELWDQRPVARAPAKRKTLPPSRGRRHHTGLRRAEGGGQCPAPDRVHGHARIARRRHARAPGSGRPSIVRVTGREPGYPGAPAAWSTRW